jgi:putative SbcD/Mre11-related phosphoesterase
MDKSRLEISPGIWLDHRRAAFLEADRILCVSDLHLGYAWAHRYSGQLMPLRDDDLLQRLSELCAFYKPAHLAILGDIVHYSVPVVELKRELTDLFRGLRQLCGLKLILGNHDQHLRKLADDADEFDFLDHFETEKFLLLHGHEDLPARPPHKRIIMGHEHPSISLGDGIRSAKFPCFAISRTTILLPAFSLWAAGVDISGNPFLGPLAKAAEFTRAVAICGEKLLPVKLSR